MTAYYLHLVFHKAWKELTLLWIQYAIFIAMMIGAIILHEKFKNSKFLNNRLLKLFTLLVIVIVIALVVAMIFIFKGK